MQALKLSIAILTSILIPAPALAGILSTTGIARIPTPIQGNLPTADTIQVVEETTNVAFPDGGIALNAGKIAPGTLVNSYNIIFTSILKAILILGKLRAVRLPLVVLLWG